MDENLQRLVRALREEKCPRRVHDAVARDIAAQRATAGRFRPALALATVMVIVLACVAIWRWTAADAPQSRPQLVEQSPRDAMQIVAQAEGALGFIGHILIEVGAHSETAISQEAVSPLRNSLENTKQKISQLIEL
jgi:hypothetical protein